MLQITQFSCGVSPSTFALTRARTAWLQALDDNPRALLAHLSQRPTHRLGVYFEQLWQFFLQQDPDIELLARNLPVHDNGRTLGEFDCIYTSKTHTGPVHLELAVKYFLGVPRGGDTTTAANTHEWLGPDQRDRLETKLEQLLQRQILLGDAPEAKRQLAEIGIGDMSREIALKGYLFQPLHDAPPPPPACNDKCAMNYWMSYGQLDSHCATVDAAGFIILPKMCWLSPALCPTADQWLTRQALKELLPTQWESDHYPLLIATLDEKGAETSRFFVTPGHWPDSHE